jgi:hypothetical protein
MKQKVTTLLLWICASAISAAGLAAADGKFGLAADNRIQAQQLVREIMAANPGLLTAGMHCVPPGGEKQKIIASTLNVIGKPSDPEDILRGSTTISPNLKVPKLGIMLPLHDRTGKEIGSLGLAFKYQAGEDQVKYLAQATAIRDRVAQQIPTLASLFEPAP